MESLTKENFWNALTEKYPEQMKQFCDWVDEYKQRIDWDNLFRENDSNIAAPKFHDLPIAMQFGIFCQFSIESGWHYKLHSSMELLPEIIRACFDVNSNVPTKAQDPAEVDHQQDILKVQGGATE